MQGNPFLKDGAVKVGRDFFDETTALNGDVFDGNLIFRRHKDSI